jgi:hypothetical protein
MWNTGARIVANGLAHRIHIVDLEDTSRTIDVPAREARLWDGTIYPWCSSDMEVLQRAFKVTNADTGQIVYYLYQHYDSDRLCYYKHPLVNNLIPSAYGQRLSVSDSVQGGAELPPQSNVDIFIMKSHVWGMSAGNDVGAAQYLLDQALAAP